MTISQNFHTRNLYGRGRGEESRRHDGWNNSELLEKLRDICLGSSCGIWRDNKFSQGTDRKTQYALRRRRPADKTSAAGSAVAGSGSAILDSRIRYLPRNAALRHSRYGIRAPADHSRYRFAWRKLLSQTPHYSLWLWGWSSPLSRSDIIRQRTITQTAAAFLPPRSTCTPQPAERFLFYSAPECQTPRSRHHSHISASTWSPLTTHLIPCSAGGGKHFAAVECASCSLYYSLTVNFFYFTHRKISCTDNQLIDKKSQHWRSHMRTSSLHRTAICPTSNSPAVYKRLAPKLNVSKIIILFLHDF